MLSVNELAAEVAPPLARGVPSVPASPDTVDITSKLVVRRERGYRPPPPSAKGSKAELDGPPPPWAGGFKDEEFDGSNRNKNWEDGVTSWDEFGHDNEHCGLARISVQEWEDGKYWEGSEPVIVTDVTDGWAANENWKLSEMLRLYPDAEVTTGDVRGPDAEGNLLAPTTVKEFITKYMYHPFKYFFDKVAVPKAMLDDCRPFPMPTRQVLEDTNDVTCEWYEEGNNCKQASTEWRNHLAFAIGSDLKSMSFHHHGSAWNVVIFGKKRWIMYDPKRWQDKSDSDRQQRVALASDDDDEWDLLPTPEWIRQLYPDPFRQNEIRTHGNDCIQHAGEMIYLPEGWMHMVMNIGDTVSVESEAGMGKATGKVEEDFLYDPFDDSSDDSGDDSSDDDSSDDGPPPGWFEESSSDDGEEEDSSDD